MIPKVDTYFYNEFKRYLKSVISTVGTENERYIIEEALGDMEEGTYDKFVKTFCTADSAKSIDVTYAFPKQKEQVDARFTIYRGNIEETSTSIGMDQAVAEAARPAAGENTTTDYVPVLQDDNGYYFELTQPIYELISINEMGNEAAFVDFEARDDDPNRINLTKKAGSLLGIKFSISYVIADTGYRKDYGGVDLGFASKDAIVVQAISNNLDTVRCLDSLLKFILILMRSSQRESRYYQLAHVSSQGLQLGREGNGDMDNPLFVIPTIVSYEVNYSVRNDTKSVFEKILLNGKDK